jgi:membrane-bound lytic murein transglycosylase D
VRDLRKQRKAAVPAIRYHKVTSGQNLSIIADRYGVEVQDLKVWNKLKGNVIIPGQKLKIYAAGKAPKPAAKVTYITYKVKVGDTLSGIAEKFEGTTVADIKKANGLKKATIQPGMLLKIIKG